MKYHLITYGWPYVFNVQVPLQRRGKLSYFGGCASKVIYCGDGSHFTALKLARVFFLLLGIILPAYGDDYRAAIGVGGLELRKSDSISMETENLLISKEKIKVKYVFLNESNKAVESLIAFPLPPFTCVDSFAKFTDEFEVRVNGARITPKREVKAYEEGGPDEDNNFKVGKEISERVRSAGLPLNCLDEINNSKLLDRAQIAGLASVSNDRVYFNYLTAIQYYWTQHFPAKSQVTIEHEYRPIVGSGVSGLHYPNEFNLTWSRDIHIRFDDDKREHKISDVYEYKIVNFILTTARSWTGPIKHFKLTIIGKDKDEYIGSSLGPINALGSNQFQVVKSDFHPKDELVVIFGRGWDKAANK